MGIPRIPSVNVYTQDKSDIFITGTSAVFGCVVEAEKGFEDLITVTSSRFTKLLGTVDNAENVTSYIGAAKMMEEAQQLVVGACYRSDAKFGGVYITDKGIVPFTAGKGSLNDYEMTGAEITDKEKIVKNETVSTSGYQISTLTLLGSVHQVAVVPGSVSVKFINAYDNVEYTYNFETSGLVIDNRYAEDGSSLDPIIDVANTYFNHYTGTFKLKMVSPYTTNELKLSYTTTSGVVVIDEIITDGSSTAQDEFLYRRIKPVSVKAGALAFTYIISGITYTGAISVGNEITGTGITSGTFDRNTGAYTITFTSAIPTSITFSSYTVENCKVLGAIVAYGNKAWSDRVGYKITDIDSVNNTFDISEYELQTDSSVKFIKTYTVSRGATDVDGFGKATFLETAFESSYLGVAFNNDTETATLVPTNLDVMVMYMDGGDTGTDPYTDTDRVTMINKFQAEDIYVDDFCGNGYISKTIIDAINTLINLKNIQGWIDNYDIIGDAVVGLVTDYTNNTINLDSMRMICLSPWADVSYNGVVYVCPMSSIALNKRAKMIKNNNYYMMPAGSGEDYGSINVVRLHKYYDANDHLALSKVGVNTVRYSRSLGNVISDNLTMQRKMSATSFGNSVITLNKMIREFNAFLPQLNLNRIINNASMSTLRVLIEGFLRQLQVLPGTIEPEGTEYGWRLIIEELNDAVTRDNKEINAELVFSFQSVLRHINLTLTYMSNQLIVNFN